MRRRLLALAAFVSLTAATSLPAPGIAQTTIPRNTQIEIAYAPPKSERYQAIYQRIKALQVFEILQQFLSPLRLPRKIQVRSEECGQIRHIYEPGSAAVICYEYVYLMEQTAPQAASIPIAGGRITKEGIIVGAFVNEVLSQVGLAIFDVLKIPVWGSATDSADNVAALIMSQFGDQVAWRTLVGTSWFLAQRSFQGRGSFTDVTAPSEAPRFYGYLCIAYAANPQSFSFLSYDIPKDRLDWCHNDYRKLVRSFKQTILPHVDANRLAQIRTVDWMTRLHMTTKN
jgi:hypothetical protein